MHEMTMRRRVVHWVSHHVHFFIFGCLCIAWFLFRTGTKPTRIVYPCQQASIAGAHLWLAAYLLPLVSIIRSPGKGRGRMSLYLGAGITTIAIIVGALIFQGVLIPVPYPDGVVQANVTSEIFVVNGTSGNDGGVDRLLDLMEREGTPFYATANGPPGTGIIAKDDVVIIKVNAQWDERGGTNTDLVKSLIQAIVDHPDGFTGEIIVADNGQAQYGPDGTGGDMNFTNNNAEDRAQSMARVVGAFSARYRVSTYLWDIITTKRAREYAEGDLDDGYIVNETKNPRTGIYVSYPKFRTQYGTYVSFKEGIWNATTGAYMADRLKVVNVPVLKTHGTYGVTGAVKHYMGVPSDNLTARMGSRTHSTVNEGGMGTEMAETRFPAITILDAIWINARPIRAGPRSPYVNATQTSIIAASTDPVALDYWAAQTILMPTATSLGYSDLSSMDPENQSRGKFGAWLRLSMMELRNAGYPATVDRNAMHVYSVER
jgi:hypothetical protein